MENAKHKPTWLEILEAESWQAELLVSGLAIFGCFQLPDLLIDCYDWLLLHIGEGYLTPLFYTVWYLMIASSMLIVNFIVHFALRALWIGMIGLVSVYPNGINRDSDMFSRDFMDKLLRDFPDVNEFNEKLDRIASQIFAFSFGGAFAMFSFSIILLTLLLITALIHLVFSNIPQEYIFYLLFVLLLTPSMFAAVLNTKRFREKEWVKKIHYPIVVKIFGKALFTFFYKPVNYISYIFFTNNKKSVAGATFFVYLLLVMLISMPTLMRSNAILHEKGRFFRMDNRSDRSFYFNYEDQLEEDRFILHPIISSEKIGGSQIKVFIPFAEREEKSLEDLCGNFKPSSNNLEVDIEREEERQFRLDCLRRYYQFYINNQPLPSDNLLKHSHANRKEEGSIIYLPTDHCQIGLNYLKITFEYYNDKGQQKEAIIPFWYDPEKD